ncbi:MAG: glycosyltransferase family 9 protein [Candidatus Omnitrophica bacterium]|nr:glycosyltransferase family 9 protein [Candidatus Omnitrophota bacterium]MDD5737072.1 glycosyltransferase family 9 protein [Candidatus Omnitrophota bacterium]
MKKTAEINKPGKVLVLAVSGIGENIMLLPFLLRLRKGLPEAYIAVAVRSEASARLMKKACPADEIITCDYGIQNTFLKKLSFIRELRGRRFDVAINTFPSSRPDKAALCLLSGAGIIVSHGGGPVLTRILSAPFGRRIPADKRLHDIEQNMRLLSPLGIIPDETDGRDIPDIPVSGRRGASGRLTAGIHPGSSKQFGMLRKRWPREKFAALAVKLADDKGARVLVFVGPDDEDAVFAVENKYAGRISFVRKPIEEIPDEINNCGLFIGNDSALVHISAALGVPTIAIFGPSDPARTRPRGRNVSVVKSADLNSLSVSEIFEAACRGLR